MRNSQIASNFFVSMLSLESDGMTAFVTNWQLNFNFLCNIFKYQTKLNDFFPRSFLIWCFSLETFWYKIWAPFWYKILCWDRVYQFSINFDPGSYSSYSFFWGLHHFGVVNIFGIVFIFRPSSSFWVHIHSSAVVLIFRSSSWPVLIFLWWNSMYRLSSDDVILLFSVEPVSFTDSPWGFIPIRIHGWRFLPIPILIQVWVFIYGYRYSV